MDFEVYISSFPMVIWEKTIKIQETVSESMDYEEKNYTD